MKAIFFNSILFFCHPVFEDFKSVNYESIYT